MRVALTGTPGTGKTSISESLEDFEVVHLTDYIKDKSIGDTGEEIEVRPEKLREAIDRDFSDKKNIVFEGHLSHHLDVDLCIVLRCEPEELRERLRKRPYSAQKVEENVQSEIIDIILQESVQSQENIKEIDTTSKTVEESALLVRNTIENRETGYGDVDWTGAL